MPVTTLEIDKSLMFDNMKEPTVRFNSINKALQYATRHNIHGVILKVGIGDFTEETISIPAHMIVAIEGVVSGLTFLGNINWKVSGGFLDSGLLLRNLSVRDVTINDGETPATMGALVTENVSFFPEGGVLQTGTSFVNVVISGISAANQSITGFFVASQIVNNLIVPNCHVALQNTAVDGYVSVSRMFAAGCRFEGTDDNGVHIYSKQNQCEILNSLFLDKGKKKGTISFSSKDAGMLYVDGTTYSNELNIVNGTICTDAAPNTKEIMILPDNKTTLLTTSDVSHRCLVLLDNPGTLNPTIEFPQKGFWHLDCSQLLLDENRVLTVQHQGKTYRVTEPGLYDISINATKIVMK